MSTFYASKVEEVAAAGEAHNAAMRKRFPKYEDQLRVLNLNVRLALVGDAQVPKSVGLSVFFWGNQTCLGPS